MQREEEEEKKKRKKFGKKEEFGEKKKSSLLSLAIDLFAQHGIVATRANERHLRLVS